MEGDFYSFIKLWNLSKRLKLGALFSIITLNSDQNLDQGLTCIYEIMSQSKA
jgi:hypothetical protein